MSSPKPIQVPPPSHVKFTKDGRAYADIDRLIDSELERVGIPIPPAEQPSRPEDQNRNPSPDPKR
jgi:hypothetical protein